MASPYCSLPESVATETGLSEERACFSFCLPRGLVYGLLTAGTFGWLWPR